MKPSLVMIPGTLCDARVFAPQIRHLRALARITTLDGTELGTRRGWADELLQRLPERFCVAGFSLGGLWALELLRRAPQRIAALALIASNAEAGSRRGKRRSAELWRHWRSSGPAAVARQLKPRYFHHPSRRARHAALVRDMAEATPAPVARTQFAWAAQRPDGLAALAAHRGHLLIVSGEHDGLCPRPWQRRMAQARNDATWVELPRCGHFVPLEAPAELTRLLARWLREAATDIPGVHP